MELLKELPSRFWSKVEQTPTCWTWNGAKNDVGYGQLRFGKHIQYAHRMSYEAYIGPIPERMVIDHICHNAGCVNPEHLRAASKKQNAENQLGAQRNSKSGFRGVWQISKNGRWTGQVKHRGGRYAIGCYATAEEANMAAIAKRNELFTFNDVDRASS